MMSRGETRRPVRGSVQSPERLYGVNKDDAAADPTAEMPNTSRLAMKAMQIICWSNLGSRSMVDQRFGLGIGSDPLSQTTQPV